MAWACGGGSRREGGGGGGGGGSERGLGLARRLGGCRVRRAGRPLVGGDEPMAWACGGGSRREGGGGGGGGGSERGLGLVAVRVCLQPGGVGWMGAVAGAGAMGIGRWHTRDDWRCGGVWRGIGGSGLAGGAAAVGGRSGVRCERVGLSSGLDGGCGLGFGVGWCVCGRWRRHGGLVVAGCGEAAAAVRGRRSEGGRARVRKSG